MGKIRTIFVPPHRLVSLLLLGIPLLSGATPVVAAEPSTLPAGPAAPAPAAPASSPADSAPTSSAPAPSELRPEPSVLPPAPAVPPTPAKPPTDRPGALETPELPAPVEKPESYNDWRYIVIHHSATPNGNAASFDRMHRAKGWDGVAYHFVITNGKGGPDGGLQVSDRWWQQKHGAHAGGLPGQADPGARNDYNEFGIGICLVGNFEKSPPTRKQMLTLARLVRRLRGLFDLPQHAVFGHRHVKSTACPGRHFSWKTLAALLKSPLPRDLHRRTAAVTYERCPWCLQSGDAAPSGRWQPGMGNSADIPPPVRLRTFQ